MSQCTSSSQSTGVHHPGYKLVICAPSRVVMAVEVQFLPVLLLSLWTHPSLLPTGWIKRNMDADTSAEQAGQPRHYTKSANR